MVWFLFVILAVLFFRAHSVPDAIDNGPLSAPPTMLKFYPNIFFKQEKSDDEKDSHPPLNLSLPPTPKGCSGGRDTESPLGPSASVSSTNSELTSQVVTSSSHPSSPRPRLSSSTTDQHINPAHQSYTRHHFPPWSPYLPTPSMMASHWLNGSPSALLSPAPSSLGSSQEDLRLAATHSVPLSSVSNLVFESDPWRLPWPYPVWHCFQLGMCTLQCVEIICFLTMTTLTYHLLVFSRNFGQIFIE